MLWAISTAQLKLTRHIKKQECISHGYDTKQLDKTDSEMIQTLELEDKYCETIIINMLKDLKEKGI